ncbi:MAG: aminoglycoside phosphotransferase family protein [candidate division KSB1 bacterium]|nr:aminoglycoside phosphotransferase family protein [candidate division KSB1 bacterium]MDZ7365087.1 aminoglycoside phosphotransferase family protein [candidate division KSB1 bacterium]MDZ7407245.1 aminoglycoside phosphotransferase family protein [candidate division KSB1 bacterium]
MGKSQYIPDDCEYPQLREITDTEKLARKLEEHLGPDSGLHVENCKIAQLHYRPGGGCKISVKAYLGRNGQYVGEQIYMGMIAAGERRSVETIQERATPRRLAQPQFGPPLIFIPEWALFLWAYPNDPNLPGLALMESPEKILERVKAAPDKFGLSAARTPLHQATITAAMTKYIPGQRCGYVYHLAFNGANGNGEYSVYGKAYRDGSGEAAYEIMRQIWESEASQKGDLLLPQPYSFDAENSILWQEAISGEPLAKIATAVENLPAMAQEIGARLAALHAMRLPLKEEMTLAFQIDDLRRSVDMISRTFPEYAARCEKLGQMLLSAAAGLPALPSTPVHGSFKFSHIFATTKGLVFIDFDGANLGDPAYDVGRFIAHVHKMKADFHIDPEDAEKTIASFCESYNRAAVSPLAPERINWFSASHLLASQIYKAVKRINPGAMNKLLKMAERLCPS